MLMIDGSLIAERIANLFRENSEVIPISDDQKRFSIAFDFGEYSLVLCGSDARVRVKLPVSNFSTALKDALLVSICSAREAVADSLKPYKLTVWKSKSKHVKGKPKLEALAGEQELHLEICSVPCDISTVDQAQVEAEKILLKSVEWIVSYSFTGAEGAGAEEGRRRQSLASRVERSSANRRICLEKYGYVCQVCDEEMTSKYGELAEHFIHVHHLEGLASSGVRWIDPTKDLIAVCPNCHSMLHRQTPPLTPVQLRMLIATQKGGEE
jgi:hypothetical protein